MAAAAEQLSQNIRDQFLQCKICLDGLKEPKTLPCLHTFCAECIICYAEHNLIDNRKFACPICRRNIYIPKNGIEGFPDSFFVQSLNDVIQQTGASGGTRVNECGICKFKEAESQASVMCIDCKIDLCEDCGKTHTSAKVTENHTMLPLGGGPNSSLTRDNYCRVHRGETIKYYCETCNSPICLPCTFLDHQGHDVSEIKEVRHAFTAGISNLVQQSEDNIMQLESARDDLIELENELFIRKESVKSEIRRSIQEVIRNLNEHEGGLLTEIDEFFDTISVARDRQMVDRTIFRLQRAHDFAKQLLETDTSPVVMLVNRSDAKDNLDTALAYELPDITEHSAKLDNHMYFLPGISDFTLGSLLQCHGAQESSALTTLRHTVPSTKAIFMYRLRSSEGYSLGEVLSIGILPSGDIVVLVTEAKKVKVFNNRGKLRYEFGDDDELQHPSDMAITSEGDITVTDCGLRCVKQFDSIGALTLCFGGEEMFGLPIALCTDQAGRFLVCDQAKDRITVHRPDGELLYDICTLQVRSPQYMACYRDRVFLCDNDNNTIAVYKYTRDSLNLVAKLTTSAGGLTTSMGGLTTSAGGPITSAGGLTTSTGGPTTSTGGITTSLDDITIGGGGEFLDCSGMTCDKNGNLLVADNILDRIHVFNTRAELSHIVTSGRQLMRPACMAASVDNVLAVCQRGVSLDEDVPTTYEVCVYRMIKVDI